MDNTIEFRKLKKGDEEKLCDLFEKTMGDGKHVAYWDWKYFQNPAGEHMTMIALDGSRLVGNVGAMPVTMTAGGNTLLASQGVDTVIDSDHRIRTTFFKLESGVKDLMIERGVCCTYAFSIKKTYRIFTEVLGFKGVSPILKMSKVINPTPYLREKLGMRILTSPLGAAGKQAIARLSKKKITAIPGLELDEITHFDSRFDDFWHRQCSAYDVAVARDCRYLNWRYIQNPTPYKVFSVVADNHESIKGFMVLGCYQEEVTRGRIVDILVEPGNREIADLLLTRAINYFIDQKVDVITCWMFDHWPIFAALKSKGFVPRETPHDLMVRSFVKDPGNEYLADISRWYMTMGDSDYY